MFDLDVEGFYCLCVTGLVEVVGEKVFDLFEGVVDGVSGLTYQRHDDYSSPAMIFLISVVVCAALTWYRATVILPFSSTTKVERITP
jgi:hypothetical protein